MSTSELFYCIAIELDSGVLFVAENGHFLGSDDVIPAVLQLSGLSNQLSFQLEKQALPDYTDQDTWINREAAVIEVSPDSGSVYDGVILLDGIIEAEPSEQDGILSLRIIERKTKIVTLPNFGEITATEFPNAPDQSQGELKPLIIGTVENAELIPVDQQKHTSLSENINDTSTFISVDDATELSASGSVTIDGVDYSYTDKTDDRLLGMTITQFHRAGTVVAQTGSAKYLAAGHSVTAIDTIKTDSVINASGTVDIANATLTFNQLPTVKQINGQENIISEFDEIDISDTASLSINAIKAVTAIDTNISATGLPFSINTGAVELSRSGVIDFPAPTQDRIIKGTYIVTFSINHNGNTGNAEVKIGEQIVWVLNGGSVVYNNVPVTFFYHESTNQLPVSITRDSISGSIDVSVSAATRTISLGNLDSALYGQIATTEQFVANQVSIMPSRGVITKAQLGIEWFATDDFVGVADVYFDTILLGQLSADNPAGQTVSENITVDITSQGSAFLASGDINKSFAGGTASLSNVTSVFYEALTASYRYYNGLPAGQWYFGKTYFNPPSKMIAGLHSITVHFNNGNTFSGDAAVININGTDHPQTFDPTGAGSAITHNISIPAGATIYFWHTAITTLSNRDNLELLIRVASITIEWNINPISQNNTATYQSVSQSNRNLNNTGITTSHSGAGQNINIAIPAPPRTVVNTFALPSAVLEQWQYFTNKQVKITYTSAGSEKIALVRAVLLIDYDVQINQVAKQITANITGKSSNPADVLALLANATQQTLDVAYLAKLNAWSIANNYLFSRVLKTKTDALQLLSRASQQVGVALHSRQQLTPIRWFDTSDHVTVITDDDFLSPVSISYAAQIYNVISLKYRHNGSKFTRVIKADESNNIFCKVSQLDIKEKRYIEIQSMFISDDATAQTYLLNHARRYAQQRKLLAFELPFVFDGLQDGSLINYQNTHFKITQFSTDNGWISATAEEIKQ